MKPGSLVLKSLLLALMVLGTTPGVVADGKKEHDMVREALRRGEVLPLAKILAIAEQHVPGDVIEVELEIETQGLLYEIKILTQTGRVREVKIDARTGVLLNIEDD